MASRHLLFSSSAKSTCGCYEAGTIFIDIDIFLQMTFGLHLSQKNNETDANSTEASLPSEMQRCKGAFQQTTFSCSSGRILVVICSTGVRGGPGWQLTPSPRRKIIKQLTVIILLALNEVLRFTLHYTLQDCCVQVRPTTRVAPLSWTSKITIFRSGALRS